MPAEVDQKQQLTQQDTAPEVHVIKSGELKPVVKEGKLFVTVTGPSHDALTGAGAKKTAWDFRFDRSCPSGFGNAGIEGYSSVFKAENKRLARTFCLIPGI